MPYKKYLCVFADKRLKLTLKRFEKQAKDSNFYDGIYLYSEDNLEKRFYKHFKDKFKLRGFGYWAWKPQIILQTFEKINDGDILQYTDAGCHLTGNGMDRLREYFETAGKSETGLLGFNMPQYTEKEWTKGDLFDYFGVRDREDIFEGQYVSGIIFAKKCDVGIEIVKKWLQVFYDDFSLVDDSPSKSPNFVEFKENRHDQSVWSLLAKINGVPCFSHSEQLDPGVYPIYAARDKCFKGTMVKKLCRRILPQPVFNILKNIYRRMKNST
ncbi:MAG: hypothetical protein LBC53_09365 [Spirochaetaceae bacterium]|jgi:hypothetical protein|nr:hypothetical protein [Spirochaetaceae bacterium]